jgi:hypothetical protein
METGRTDVFFDIKTVVKVLAFLPLQFTFAA